MRVREQLIKNVIQTKIPEMMNALKTHVQDRQKVFYSFFLTRK